MKTIHLNLAYCTDGIYVGSIQFDLDDYTVANIKSAQKILGENKILTKVCISGESILNSIVQYDSEVEDEDRLALSKDDESYFRMDTSVISINEYGIYFTGSGKYDSSSIIEVDLTDEIISYHE